MQLFFHVRNFVMHMKNWIKKPEDFVKIFCHLPLSIHTQCVKTSSPGNYKNLSVGKKKSDFHIVQEASLKFSACVSCFQ